MSLFKAYKGHRKLAKQVSDIITSSGDYYPIEELICEIPTDQLSEWLAKNGIEPVAEMPQEIKGVIDEVTA
jgi:hypothetical protein